MQEPTGRLLWHQTANCAPTAGVHVSVLVLAMRHAGFNSDQRLNPCPLQCKHRILNPLTSRVALHHSFWSPAFLLRFVVKTLWNYVECDVVQSALEGRQYKPRQMCRMSVYKVMNVLMAKTGNSLVIHMIECQALLQRMRTFCMWVKLAPFPKSLSKVRKHNTEQCVYSMLQIMSCLKRDI